MTFLRICLPHPIFSIPFCFLAFLSIFLEYVSHGDADLKERSRHYKERDGKKERQKKDLYRIYITSKYYKKIWQQDRFHARCASLLKSCDFIIPPLSLFFL